MYSIEYLFIAIDFRQFTTKSIQVLLQIPPNLFPLSFDIDFPKILNLSTAQTFIIMWSNRIADLPVSDVHHQAFVVLNKVQYLTPDYITKDVHSVPRISNCVDIMCFKSSSLASYFMTFMYVVLQ